MRRTPGDMDLSNLVGKTNPVEWIIGNKKSKKDKAWSYMGCSNGHIVWGCNPSRVNRVVGL
ncbi:MAG: hypothetical protein V3R78_06130 [Thermodesulfobacteriota bacterium]